MTTDKGILIQNIYYMLTYAFRILRQGDYERIAGERFENIHDLFAAILTLGVTRQLKQGLYCEYVLVKEDLSVIRGKLSVHDTLILQMQKKQRAACEYDDFSEDNIYNRIIKTAMLNLMRADNTDPVRKRALRKVLAHFDNIGTVNPSSVRWRELTYGRNNKNYELLLNICCFVLLGMLQTTEEGVYRMLSFTDEHMSRLYEKFILEYYRYHHPELHPQDMTIRWNLTEEPDPDMFILLPSMRTDITLRKGVKTLIIDAKYYGHVLSEHFGRELMSSPNLYQLFTYVKNCDTQSTGDVSGLLLYAKTGEAVFPHGKPFMIGGSSIGATVLDLNCEFCTIAQSLEDIVAGYFRTPPQKSPVDGAE